MTTLAASSATPSPAVQRKPVERSAPIILPIQKPDPLVSPVQPEPEPAPASAQSPAVSAKSPAMSAQSPVAAPAPLNPQRPRPDQSDGNVYRVTMDFNPSLTDELSLQAGQLVRMLHEYDDGWVSLQSFSALP